MVTSLVRAPAVSHRAWRGIHLASYAAWGLGVLHGFGIGTDATHRLGDGGDGRERRGGRRGRGHPARHLGHERRLRRMSRLLVDLRRWCPMSDGAGRGRRHAIVSAGIGHTAPWLGPAPPDLAAALPRGAPRTADCCRSVCTDRRASAVRGRGAASRSPARWPRCWTRAQARVVVVNASEGEPGSAKDSALMLTAPHLVLDGAELVARALGVDAVSVVVPGERPGGPAGGRGTRSRSAGDGMRYDIYADRRRLRRRAGPGGDRAVRGPGEPARDGLEPEAVSGLRGRPTLLSNAETFAQVAALAALGATEYARAGTPEEPGTTLLTVAVTARAASSRGALRRLACRRARLVRLRRRTRPC